MSYSCDICGNGLESDENKYGISDPSGKKLVLCSLHAETSRRVARDNKIEDQYMRLATLRLNRIRPDAGKDPLGTRDSSSADELVKLYRAAEAGEEEFQVPVERSGEHISRDLEIVIPGEHVREISEGEMIENELLKLLSFCTGKEVIEDSPQSTIQYDDYAEPVSRLVKYGDTHYGLVMNASPISSGVGVHGEEAKWLFKGLPPGLEVTGRSRLDMRGGSWNFFGVLIKGDNIRVKECIQYLEKTFALEIKKLIT